MSVRGILFDCDGVLVDSEPLTTRVMRDSLAAHGLEMTLEEVDERFVGGTMAGVLTQATAMGALLPEGWVDDVYAQSYAVLREQVELIPGVIEMLDRCDAAGLAYAVGSNGRSDKMQITLGRTGLLDRFEGRMFSAQEVGQPKPAPDVYLFAANALSLSPEDCVVIEDSATGVKAAIAAGMRCFAYVPDGDGRKQAAAGATVFRDMAELPDLLK